MIDCDLYSSAKEALNFCGPLILDEAIIFFDDWAGPLETSLADEQKGEKRAFDEFLQEHPQLKAVRFGTYYHTELGDSAPESAIFRVSRVT